MDKKGDARGLEADPGSPRREEAPRHETGRHEEHEGHGHLAGHEAVAEVRASSRNLGGGGLASELAREVGPRGPKRGNEARHEPGGQGHEEREGEHARVEAQVEREGDGDRERERGQEAGRGPGETGPRQAAEQGEHEALGQELADEAAPAGPDRHADPDLAPTGGGPGQEQARHVRAGDEQDEADEAHGRGRDGEEHAIGCGVDAHAWRRTEREATVLVGLRIGPCSRAPITSRGPGPAPTSLPA